MRINVVTHHRLIVVLILSLLLISLVNVEFYPLLLLRNFLSLLFIFFIPGYLFVNLLSFKKEDSVEKFILIVGTSISFTIILSMFLHFLGMRIGLESIMALVSTTSLILDLICFFKIKVGKK